LQPLLPINSQESAHPFPRDSPAILRKRRRIMEDDAPIEEGEIATAMPHGLRALWR